MNDRKKKKRKNRTLFLVRLVTVILCLAVALLAVVVILSRDTVVRGVKQRTAEVVVDRAIEYAAQSQGLSADDPEVRELLDSISEEDRQTVTEIVADHFTAETVTEIVRDLKDGDQTGALAYAQEELTEEEKQTLLSIAEKYGYSFGE